MAQEKPTSTCIICYDENVPHGQMCCTTTNLCKSCQSMKPPENCNCCTGPSSEVTALRDVTYHPLRWSADKVAHFLNRPYGTIPVVFSRPAQRGWDRAADRRGEIYHLPNHEGVEMEGWLWTNWKGDVVESWVERLDTREVKEAIRQHAREERSACLDLRLGWFCFGEVDRGYIHYRGRFGPPGDGKAPLELRQARIAKLAGDNGGAEVEEVMAEEPPTSEEESGSSRA